MTKNPYEKLAHIYIRLVRGYSPTASGELEKIRAAYGARAAYYAALGLALLARKVKFEGTIDPQELYTHHLADSPEVLPLYHRAVEGLSSDLLAMSGKV